MTIIPPTNYYPPLNLRTPAGGPPNKIQYDVYTLANQKVVLQIEYFKKIYFPSKKLVVANSMTFVFI